MKLATKGVLIVAVPVVMQVILIITMSALLWQANTEAATAASAKEIVAECNRLIQTTMVLVKRSYGLEGDSTSFTSQDIAAIESHITSLRQKMSAEKQQTPAFQELSKMSSNFIPMLEKVKNHSMEAQGSRFRSERYLFIALENFLNQVTSVISSVNTVHLSDYEQRERTTQNIKIALISFVVVSVVLTLALAYFAAVSISRPLELMAKNAERIAKRIALEPEIGGRDELSELDSLLHQVDESIDEALTSERNLITYAGDLVCSIDQNGMFRSANPYADILLGYSPERLMGSSVLDVVVSDECDKVDRLIGASAPGGGTSTLEVRMVTKNKEVIDTSWSAIWSERDSSLFCVIHDITERKNLERLKQDFIAMISHDLRTPLMSVHSSLDLVQSGATGELPPATEAQLGSASRNTEHLIELVNDLLDFEKLEAGRMDFDLAVVMLKDVFEESLQMVQALTDQSKVQIVTPQRPLTANCDLRKMVQVLVNLLSNALKHSPVGGQIRIENKIVGDMVEISVHDQGPGVPEEFRQSIFAPFEQISSRATAALGTGLGLAICRLIVEGQGGQIGVRQSELLQGSAFWLTLPRESQFLSGRYQTQSPA